MDLFDAHKKGLPLVAETRQGGARLLAEIFTNPEMADELAVADAGWPTASGHPFHILEGKVRETEEGWTVGDTPIRLAFEGEQLHEDWKAWQAYRAADGKAFDREACWRAIERSGILVPA